MNPLSDRDLAIKELGIESLPPQMQDETIAMFAPFMVTELLIATLAKLPPEAQDMFKAMTEEGRGDEAEAIATHYIPDFLVFMAEVNKKSLSKIREMRTKLDT